MKDIEDRLRAAFENQAASVAEESLRPAEAPSQSAPPVSRWSAVAHSRWTWPTVAAAAVAAVTIGISVVHDQSASRPGPSTTTPTVTGPATTSSTGPEYPVPLSEKGRRYDVGSIVSSDRHGPGSSLEIYLRRWKVYGKSDAEIARHGMQISAHTDSIVSDLSEPTYLAPVARNATFVINECSSISTLKPPRQVSAAQFLRYQNTSSVVFEFDSAGRIVDAETDGGC